MARAPASLVEQGAVFLDVCHEPQDDLGRVELPLLGLRRALLLVPLYRSTLAAKTHIEASPSHPS